MTVLFVNMRKLQVSLPKFGQTDGGLQSGVLCCTVYWLQNTDATDMTNNEPTKSNMESSTADLLCGLRQIIEL